VVQANRSKNIFALLDSDDEDNTPKVTKKTETAPPSAPVALNKPAAGNKKTSKKPFVEGDKKCVHYWAAASGSLLSAQGLTMLRVPVVQQGACPA
jgi:hypothetical protein